MDNVCNRCLFSIPSKVEMAEEQEYLQPHQDLGLSGFSFARYLARCFSQVCRALYRENGDALSVPVHLNVAKRQVPRGSCIR